MNFLSVDVDDAWHALHDSFSVAIPANHEPPVPCAVDLTLAAIESTGSRATFFVQGWIARRWPATVRAIHARGHRVASHGMTHKLVYQMSRDEFRQSLTDSRHLLEDIVGERVTGYRSPSFSIVPVLADAIESIREAGYAYDSSAHFRRSQLNGASVAPLRLTLDNGLVEFPLSTLFAGGRGVSIGSSFYCRRFPTMLHRFMLRSVEKRSGGVHVYFHPWELAGETMSLRDRLRYPRMLIYRGGESTGARRIAALLRHHRYEPLESALEPPTLKNEGPR